MTERVSIFTDGACKGNPGPGGWGAVLRYRDAEKEIAGSDTNTTNNRMEMLAAITALEILRRPIAVDIYTDSEYLRNGITQWIHNWKRRGWLTAARQPVKNADLWQRLEEAATTHQVTWHWVKGHAGNPGNERADRLARNAVPGVSNGGSRPDQPKAKSKSAKKRQRRRQKQRQAAAGETT